MRDDADRLRDILKAIDHIMEKTKSGRNAFDQDDMLQVWVLHHLQIVGEAARCLSQEFRQRHSNAVWSGAIRMRHILVHHYSRSTSSKFLKVVEHDRPALKKGGPHSGRDVMKIRYRD
jgi:uncharacterized protein with HEPN domain